MEEKNVLSEAEEAAVAGGNVISAGGSSYTCPSCGSENVTVTVRKRRNGAKMVVGSCNDCGHTWSFPLPQ